jgi:hypothetical protein
MLCYALQYEAVLDDRSQDVWFCFVFLQFSRIFKRALNAISDDDR